MLPADVSPSGRTLLKALAATAIERTILSSHAEHEFRDIRNFGEVLGFAFRQASIMKSFGGEHLMILPHDEWDRIEIIVPIPDQVDKVFAGDIISVIESMSEMALRTRHKPVENNDPWLYLFAERGAPDNFAYQTGLLLRTGYAQAAYQYDRKKDLGSTTQEHRNGIAIAHYESLLTLILNMALRALVSNTGQFNFYHDILSRIRQEDGYLVERPIPWQAQRPALHFPDTRRPTCSQMP